MVNSKLTVESSAGEGFLFFFPHTPGSRFCPALVGGRGMEGEESLPNCLSQWFPGTGPSTQTLAFSTHPLLSDALTDHRKTR